MIIFAKGESVEESEEFDILAERSYYIQGDKYVSERFEEVLVRLCIDSENFFFYKKDCLGIYLLKVIKQIFL